MSRRQKSSLGFGSDSFLDVVANIVGILIILIVIAGLRVSRTPIHVASIPISEEGADYPLEPLFADEDLNSPAPKFVSAAPKVDPDEPALLEPPEKLSAAIGKMTDETRRLEDAVRIEIDHTANLRTAAADLQKRRTDLQRRLTDLSAQKRLLSEDQDRRRTSLDQLQTTERALLQQIETEERKSPPVEEISHRVTPLGREVSGQEQHYRLAGNRVSEVPIAALAVRLKSQLERRKDWLLKQRTATGEVGPLGGYVMSYIVQRDSAGVLDEVRYGQAMVRMSVSNWRIEPTNELTPECADEALAPGSLFYDSLLAADEGTTLTFWVYPDSFELYRRLQKFAHEQGFLVAGRPLPHGIPISGSPSGMKSSGQ